MDTAFYQAKFFSSLKRVGSVAPTRVGSKFGSPKVASKALPGTSATGGSLHGAATHDPQEGALSGDALTARLKEIANGNGHGAAGAAIVRGAVNGGVPVGILLSSLVDHDG